jgi:DNA polymerase II small subunit/DNA polymerase delta subunit B
MELTEFSVPFDECRLYGMADLHIGSKEFDEKACRQTIAAIKADPRARVIIPGDILDYVTPTSVQDVQEQTMAVDEQEEYAIDLLTPISSKILYLLSGNHENRTKEHNKAIKRIAKRLSVNYADDDVLFEVSCGKKANGKPASYIVYATHGFGGGKTIGATANAVDSLAHGRLADIYIMGHNHKVDVHDDNFEIPDPQNHSTRMIRRVYVALRAFQGHTRFGRQKGMKPHPTGAVMIRLSGKEKSIKVEI